MFGRSVWGVGAIGLEDVCLRWGFLEEGCFFVYFWIWDDGGMGRIIGCMDDKVF